jgi:hypothetical protein
VAGTPARDKVDVVDVMMVRLSAGAASAGESMNAMRHKVIGEVDAERSLQAQTNATRMSSLSSRRPHAAMGIAWSQSPLC